MVSKGYHKSRGHDKGHTTASTPDGPASSWKCPPGYRIILAEDFEGDSLNESNWEYQNGDGSQFGIPGWGNGEHQVYDPSATRVADGNLIITARRDPNQWGMWISGKLISHPSHDFTYGRVEARIKFPTEEGSFPAFWMLPRDWSYGGWPRSGELDVVEYQSAWSSNPTSRTRGSAHTQEHHANNSISQDIPAGSPADIWHIYALDWTPTQITWSRDGKPYMSHHRPIIHSPDNWPFDKPFHLLLNLAIQPSWGSVAEAHVDRMEMRVDWVRVTQPEDAQGQ
ncbi:MAG: concanavalin A-like lectin/glucanase domain-containing protein [Piptocephalis tieghemiana]|nr:MAG: concanavalin A-like lectin/glucanase domain-containing protein [Piptocephalis tieghemiana]